MERVNETWIDLGSIVEGTSPPIRHRVTDRDNTALITAQITSIKRKIFDITAGQSAATLVGTETTLVLADVFFDTPRTSETWSLTGKGYNFEDIVPQSSLTGVANGKKIYMIEYRVDQASGDDFWLKRCKVTVTDAFGI